MKTNSAVKLIAKIIVSAGLLAFLLGKISTGALVDLVGRLSGGMIIAAMLVFFVSNVVGAFQWHTLLRASGVDLPFHRTFRFYFVGLFFNNFLPANIGGDAVKVYDVSRIGSSVYQVIAVTVVDRLIGIFSLCLLAAISVVWLMGHAAIESLWVYFVVFVACMLPLFVFYFIEPLGKLLRRVVGLLTPMSMDKRGTSILDYMGLYKKRKLLILRLIVLSLIIQVLRVLTHVLVAVALGFHLSTAVVVLFFVFVPLLSLAMIPPITINGLGVREGLGIILFAQAGIGRTDAFALEFLTYLVSVAISLLGMVFFLARRERRVPGEAATPPING